MKELESIWVENPILPSVVEEVFELLQDVNSTRKLCELSQVGVSTEMILALANSCKIVKDQQANAN